VPKRDYSDYMGRGQGSDLGTGKKFAGVVVPTAEGRRYGAPGLEMRDPEVKAQSKQIREETVEHLRRGDLSPGEKDFLDRARTEAESEGLI